MYTATGDYANALASHKQCVELIRSQLEDKLMVRSMKCNKDNQFKVVKIMLHFYSLYKLYKANFIYSNLSVDCKSNNNSIKT